MLSPENRSLQIDPNRKSGSNKHTFPLTIKNGYLSDFQLFLGDLERFWSLGVGCDAGWNGSSPISSFKFRIYIQLEGLNLYGSKRYNRV